MYNYQTLNFAHSCLVAKKICDLQINV